MIHKEVKNLQDFYDHCDMIRNNWEAPGRLELLAIALVTEKTILVYDADEVKKLGLKSLKLRTEEINPG